MGRAIFVIILVIVIIAVGFLVLSGGNSAEDDLADIGEAFMEALNAGDYAAAYALTDASFQSQMGNPDGLRNTFAQRGFVPDDWDFHRKSIEGETGQLEAAVGLANGNRTGIEFSLVLVGDQWRISRVVFQNS